MSRLDKEQKKKLKLKIQKEKEKRNIKLQKQKNKELKHKVKHKANAKVAKVKFREKKREELDEIKTDTKDLIISSALKLVPGGRAISTGVTSAKIVWNKKEEIAEFLKRKEK